MTRLAKFDQLDILFLSPARVLTNVALKLLHRGVTHKVLSMLSYLSNANKKILGGFENGKNGKVLQSVPDNEIPRV